MIDTENALALVESKIDQMCSAAKDLESTIERVKGLPLTEDQEDRLLLMLIKFGRSLSKGRIGE